MGKKREKTEKKRKPKPTEEESIEELKEKIEIQKNALNKIIKKYSDKK